ncbi:probable RNA-dependent RNA polymerase 5 isoform X1 [Vitis riparia]|uniref:probable RNA-dependent RNA polymerase 5 isoform X1 n=1 Tax=Vitis riparia TaxID=96939 RepID=UPI00155B16ED|nr:probable RNA-dependent RNA polymerase 5 isoform X1 [Vitis riparia]
MEVSLPHSVEQMLQRICTEQQQPPPEAHTRRNLASLGEESALELLRKISHLKIRNLSALISYMVGKAAQGDAASHSPTPKHLISSPSSTPKKARRQASSPQLVALGELEFRKAFLILSYIGDKRPEDLLSAEEILKLKNLPMGVFETEVWNNLGRKFIKEEDRQRSFDWDSDKTHIYHCHVSPDGSYRFKGPYLNKTRTHLQRVLGDENILLVKFAEDVTDRSSLNCSTDSNASYNKIAREGIFVGLRQYRFFVFKDGGKEEKKKNPTSSVKCYFVFMESSALSGKTVHEARCIFMHAHMVSSVAKYMARFSLILSKTVKLDVDLSTVNIQRIDDELGRDEDGYVVYDEDWQPLILTDGTGFISEDLALRCPNNLCRGKYMNNGNSDRLVGNVELEGKFSELRCLETHTWEPPLLIQCRLFNNGCAVKGTLLLNRKLPPRTIQIRPSMIKVETDPKLSDTQTVNSVEINGTSNQPRRSYLSKYLIALLSYGGVPNEYFMNLLKDALEDAPSVQSSKRAALRVSLRFGEMDDDSIVTRMILSGIPIDEPFLQHRLSFMVNEERKGLRVGKLPVNDCFYLMGTADPTGKLKSDEVCIILDHGQVQGRVLVYKHPGLHFGDIHVLNATYVEALEECVGNAKYAIFFPINGPRSLADEIANSDFDGDMYWVSRNQQLLQYFRASEPWMRKCSTRHVPSKRPTDFSPDELEHELFQLFLTTRFQTSSAIGMAADNWLVFMDRLLTLRDDCSDEKECLKRKMLELTDIYYDALDAPKSGMKVNVSKELKAEKFPHFMGRESSYHSTSILGQIYDAVESFQPENQSTKEIWRLPLFNIDAVPQACLRSWKDRYDQYRSDMAAALQRGGETKDEYAAEVIQKYKQILYGAAEFEESPRKLEDIFDEALAIYHVTYEFAINGARVSYCNFPWRVAGRALCKLYTVKLGEKSMVCVPSVLRQVFN